jgi:hypothetical protein
MRAWAPLQLCGRACLGLAGQAWTPLTLDSICLLVLGETFLLHITEHTLVREGCLHTRSVEGVRHGSWCLAKTPPRVAVPQRALHLGQEVFEVAANVSHHAVLAPGWVGDAFADLFSRRGRLQEDTGVASSRQQLP